MSLAAQPARPLTREEALNAVRAGATLVTGNDRLARVLREAFNTKMRAEGATVWPSPRIHSWGVWVDRLWSDLEYRSREPLPIRLTKEQERLLWEDAIGQDQQSGRLLALDATAEEARAAAELAVEWRLNESDLEAAESEDVQSFVRWRRTVERIGAAGGWASGAQAVDALIARRENLPTGELLLAGFDELTPQQGELLDAFRGAGGVVRQLVPAPRERRKTVRVPVESRRGELRAAARWARNLAERGADGKIGVVLPDLSQRRQEVERIFLEELDPAALFLEGRSESRRFVLSVGLPLDRYALVRAALLALQLHPAGTDLSVFGAWLRCDSIAGGAAERNARGLVDRQLRDKGVARVTPRKLGKLLERTPTLREAIDRWSRRHRRIPETQTPAQWAESFAHLLDALGWPGEGADGSEGRQVLQKWHDLLEAFAGLGAVAGEWNMSAAVRQLRRMAQATPFQPETPDTQVEVMSLLESAGAEVDHLWIAGLDDETWPEEPRPNAFLPLSLQRTAGLPRASVESALRFARTETTRLLAMAPDVVVSHAQSADDHKLQPGPLIAHLQEATLPEILGDLEAPLVQQMRDLKAIEPIHDAAGPPLPSGEAAVGGTKVFAHQAHCPFRAFAELRLGAKALETGSPGLAPWERGQLVHVALEHVWKDIRTSDELRGRNPGALRQTVVSGVERALQELVQKRREPLPPRFESVERSRLEELLLEWLEAEKQLRGQDFEVVECEGERSIEIRGVRADVRVDRVDELPDGRQIIVDYKTGKVTPSEWDHPRPLEPQLPLYAISQGDRLGGAVFAKLSAQSLKFEGALAAGVHIQGVGKKNDPDLAERVQQWREHLEALADAFLQGRAEVDPRDGKCHYCKLPALCRKDDAS